MKKRKERGRKFSSVLLSLLLCMALMPVGVFAGDEIDLQNENAAAQELNQDAVTDVEAGAQATEGGDIVLGADNAENAAECTHDSLKKYAEVKATCSSAGHKAYYKCDSCGKMFSDALATEEITSESDIEIPIDPNAHNFGDWQKTKEATPEEEGVLTRTCELCGLEENDVFPYVDPAVDPSYLVKSLTLDGVAVKFKSPVYKVPEAAKDIIPGRVWVRGKKKYIQVNWKNPSNLNAIDGVIILRAKGTSKTFTEVARVKFTKDDQGDVVNAKTRYNDKTATKKNKAYTYRVIGFVELSDVTYISHLTKADWAAGQITTSKLKNYYTATMNKKSAKLQSMGTTKLKATVKSPKTKFMPDSRRWSSSNKGVATVSSKGKVTARAPGKATISCRLPSGYVITSKITVVGALTPAKPKLAIDYATKTSITLIWSKSKNATSYDVYKSDDGLHWDKTPKNTKKTTYTYSGLTTGHRYTFYVVARNDHKGLDANGKSTTYTALSTNSNVINQKAVVKRRPMTLTGFPTKKSQKYGTTLSVTIKVQPPLKRKAQLQMKSGKKWVNKKTITLPKGTAKKSVTITFPNSWWNGTTEWRLVVPATTTTEGYTTDTLTVKATRVYQNPSGYVQIKNSISKHGYSHYVSPVLVNSASTKSDHIEALIKTANKYKGDKYVQGKSGAPGKGIDESGLVMQACYGAGVDLWPISPSTRPYNCIPEIMNSKLKTIKYTPAAEGSEDYVGVYRGDLIFFAKTKKGTPIHLAIYTGLGKLIHADLEKGKVNTTTIRDLESRGYVVVGVRRIFN